MAAAEPSADPPAACPKVQVPTGQGYRKRVGWQCPARNRCRRRLGGFSAVLYYFGLRLHKELDVPIGLIHSSWGGSPIEPWTVSGKGGGMYNGMIAPVKPFAIRGVVWYQGEANVGNGLAYAEKMKTLIGGWRKAGVTIFPSTSSRSLPSRDTGPAACRRSGKPRWPA